MHRRYASPGPRASWSSSNGLMRRTYARRHVRPDSSGAAGTAQEQRELVTLLAGQRGRIFDDLLDVGGEVVLVALAYGAVCALVTVTCVVGEAVGWAGSVGCHLASVVTVGSWSRARASRKCVPMSADAREGCECACAPAFTERHSRGWPRAICRA